MVTAMRSAMMKPSMLCTRAAALTALCGLAAVAAADLPKGMDRIPADAVGVVAIRDLESFKTKIESYMELFDMDPAMSPVGSMTDMLQTPGVSKNGSAFLIMLPGAENESDRDRLTVVMAPVTDFQAFSKAMNAQANGAAGLMSADMMGNNVFMKDAGSGYIVMGPDQGVVESFKPVEGSLGTFKKMMGSTALSASNAADVVVYLTMPIVSPAFSQGVKQMEEQGQMIAAMAGPQADQFAGATKMANAAADRMAADGQAVVFAVNADDSGIALDVVSQFKDGSPTAQDFQIKGTSASMVGTLPDMNYMFAGAIDLSSEMVKKFIGGIQQKGAQAAGIADVGAWQQVMGSVEKIDGMSMVMGVPPGGIMGGLMNSATMLIKTKDPAGFVSSMKAGMEKVNGQAVGNAKVQASYKPASVDVSGSKVDSWSIVMPTDPNDPNAMMAQQMNMMLYGMTPGPSGLVAQTNDAVVMTMGNNSMLMGKALDTAKTGKGVNADELFAKIAGKLPENRLFEFYISPKGLIDLAGPIIAMQMGGEPIQSPDKLSPIALAGTMEGGAMGIRLVMPKDVLQTISGIMAQMEDGGEAEPADMEDEPAEENRKPRF